MRFQLTVAAAAALLVVSVSTGAQPKTETLVLSAGTTGGLFAYDFNTSQFSTINRIPMSAVLTADRNAGTIGAYNDKIFHTMPNGSTTTIATLPNGAVTRGVARDQISGDYIVATHIGIYRLSGSSSQLMTTVIKPNAICRNRATGDLVAAGLFGKVYTVDRVDGTVDTVRTDINGITGLTYLPSSGGIIVTRSGTPDGVLILDANYNTAHTLSLQNVQGVVVSERTNKVYVVHGTSPPSVSVFSPFFRPLATLPLPVFAFSGVTRWRDRAVSVDASGARPSTATVHLVFPGATNETYCAALSLATHAGIPLGDGQLINLAPDGLFLASACGLPGLSSGFTGALFAGTAQASFQIPAALPAGLVIHVSAVMLDPARPSGLRAANGDCVQLLP